ncbi:MAG: GIY-YIG nuclease family protein [Syntrophomonadaceae bacterium]|nr:GIY-YIG nuclease family protein [Syntrophomonadaceae bacterium]
MVFVYIVQCNDGSYYTGYTTNIERRLQEHNQGLASKYTRGRRPVICVYHEELSSKSEALKRELIIKKMTRGQKTRLIAGYSSKNDLIHKRDDNGKNIANKKC